MNQSLKLFKLKSRLYLNKFLSGLRHYVFGIFLLPWVLVFGYLLIISIIVFFTKEASGIPTLSESFSQILSQQVSLFRLWVEVFIIICINYTLSFFISGKYLRVRYFFVITSLVILVFFSFIGLPFIQEAIKQL